MSPPSEDFALLIPAANAVEAKLSKELLESHGIPVLLHGMDRDMAELGASGNMEASHPDVYVPVAALKEAVKVLSETWENFDHPSLHAE